MIKVAKKASDKEKRVNGEKGSWDDLPPKSGRVGAIFARINGIHIPKPSRNKDPKLGMAKNDPPSCVNTNSIKKCEFPSASFEKCCPTSLKREGTDYMVHTSLSLPDIGHRFLWRAWCWLNIDQIRSRCFTISPGTSIRGNGAVAIIHHVVTSFAVDSFVEHVAIISQSGI